MGQDARLAAVLAALVSSGSGELVGGDPQLCATVLGADGVAVSVLTDTDGFERVWSSPGTSSLLEDVQFTVGEGPGADSARSRSLVLVPDLATVPADRWPLLLPALQELGVRAVFCFPLRIGGACLGVFTVQRSSPGPLTSTQTDNALILAATLTAVLPRGAAPGHPFLQQDGTGGGLHRAVIHQATGMVSVQASLPLDQALALLRAHAFRRERTLEVVADEVVTRRLHFRDTYEGTALPSGTEG
ncbi:GAF and ANTAR domain-containing protein [Streptomyces sp. NPDC088745]|uniref:GAF and ANTAR domain-containing protein n=1 Tax=Streptomyces sp. NPDC088745 TaxID=3365884 RepID=UPI0038254CA9